MLWFLTVLALGQCAAAAAPAGKVVWWGQDFTPEGIHMQRTNGALEYDNELVTNVIGIAASFEQCLALRVDGSILVFGGWPVHHAGTFTGFSNVVSISFAGDSFWGIKGNGTVIRAGREPDDKNVIGTLSNITAIASATETAYWTANRPYLALRKDGTVRRFHIPEFQVVGVDLTTGLPLPDHQETNIADGIASIAVMGPLMAPVNLLLKKDGSLMQSSARSEGTFSLEPVTVNGAPLRSVKAVASSDHSLALKTDGSVVAWNTSFRETNVPPDLTNAIAVSSTPGLSLAIRSDSTVVAWGANDFGRASVPAGLSNVTAVAASGRISLAITTGNIPSSVFIPPHGRIEEVEREADVIFKGTVVSSRALTNASFPGWGKPHATQFKVISVLKGVPETNEPIFWHNTEGPGGWGGGTPPSWHQFQTGQSYLVCAVALGKPAYLYEPPFEAANRKGEFRQLFVTVFYELSTHALIRCPRSKKLIGSNWDCFSTTKILPTNSTPLKSSTA
jgi:hypothetical protein